MASTKLDLSRMLPNLERKELIGSGSFGNVYRAEWDGKPVAVKILHEHYFRESHSNNECLKKFEEECKILRELQHENVVELLDFIISHKSPPMLITELLDCDLGKHIRNCHPGKIPFSETVSIMLDVAKGLAYLHHEHNPPIVHRDVASKNILLTKERQAKIADVGLAKVLPKGEQNYCSPVPGTPVYAAPETFHPDYDPRFSMSRKGRSPVEYDTKIDIFSLGITLMEVITGKLPNPQPGASPFTSDGIQIPEKDRRKGDIERMGEHKLKEVVFRCIEESSDRRPSAEELTKMLQRECSKIEQKKIIANRAGGEIPTIEVTVLGRWNVGKTCLISRFVNHKFSERVAPTYGCDHEHVSIKIHSKDFTLRVVDTAGQERFRHSIIPTLIRRSQGILLVYDVNNPSSLWEGVPEMLHFINGERPDIPSLLLVGNKADLTESKLSELVVSKEEGERFAQNCGIPFVETSAKSGENVEKVFEMIAENIYDYLDLSDIDTFISSGRGDAITVTNDPPRERGFLEKIGDCFRSGWNWFKGIFNSGRDD